MLGTLLDQIPAALSRRFLLGTFLPLVLFWAGSLMVGYTCMAAVQDLFGWFELRSTLMQAFLGTTAALALAAVGLALSGVRTAARVLLENPWPKVLRNALEDRHEARLTKLGENRKKCSLKRLETQAFHELALKRLSDARSAGLKITPALCIYPSQGSDLPARIGTRPLELNTIKGLVDELEKVLGANSVAAKGDDAVNLNRDHVTLTEILERCLQETIDKYRRTEIELAREFPGNKTYATKFARVAGSLGAYAFDHYGVDYAVLWPRLEAVARKERPELCEALQDATAQLDFHVTMFWMTCLYSLTWVVLLGCFGFNLWVFAGVAILGPGACVAWYFLGARSYAALADVAMTAVDLTRLKVFNAVGVVEPRNADEERKYWADLSSTLAFGGKHAIPYMNGEPAPSAPKEQRAYIRLERVKTRDGTPATAPATDKPKA